jgi:imidazole glycerol-phosphate synthase subunit HisH
MIGIINYGMGNLTSVMNALKFVGIESEIFSNPDSIFTYDKVILPGVGAFGQAMENLDRAGMSTAIRSYAQDGKFLLGICLGMQLLLDESCEHGNYTGLGLVKGKVKSFREKVTDLPIPHVGWNTTATGRTSRIFNNDPALEQTFYFVHSYYCDLEDKSLVAGFTDYGIRFDAAIESGNVFAAQFHPEKSQKDGLEILKKFGAL